MRLVSLLPSATEIVYALGLGDNLVGVSAECDEPASARRDKAVVVAGHDTSVMTPLQIDEHVREMLATGQDLYTLDEGALKELDPELILTQDLCGVCAVPAGQLDRALAHLGTDAGVLTLDPHTLADVIASIAAVADRAGVPERGRRLVDSLQARLDAVALRVAGLERPRVAVIEWVDPLFTAGHWVPDLVTAAGGDPVVGQSGGRSVTTTWEAIVAAQPDVLVVAPCGYQLEAALEQARPFVGRLPGVPVWAIDADGLVVRPGPRLVDGVEALSAILHPGPMPRPGTVALAG